VLLHSAGEDSALDGKALELRERLLAFMER
jgi:hypothetical protein